MKGSDGKYLATVKIGPKGQIVIPKEARELIGLNMGDNVLLLAESGQGIMLRSFGDAEKLIEGLRPKDPP